MSFNWPDAVWNQKTYIHPNVGLRFISPVWWNDRSWGAIASKMPEGGSLRRSAAWEDTFNRLAFQQVRNIHNELHRRLLGTFNG